MIDQLELDLFSSSDVLPSDIFSFSEESWENLVASEDLDKHYPIEDVATGESFRGKWSICVRGIESGVWLWGVDVYFKKQQHGVGFYPFRKWGKSRAAMRRESAIEAAKKYIDDFLRH